MNQTIEKISVNGIEYVRADQVPAAPPQKPVTLTDAAWIADTGRFETALRTGTLVEVEPCSDPVTVGRGAIVAVTLWRHALPRTVK